jgi:hypothetical protein
MGKTRAVAQQQQIRRRPARREPDPAVPPLPMPRRSMTNSGGVGQVLDRIRRVLSESRR